MKNSWGVIGEMLQFIDTRFHPNIDYIVKSVNFVLGSKTYGPNTFLQFEVEFGLQFPN